MHDLKVVLVLLYCSIVPFGRFLVIDYVEIEMTQLIIVRVAYGSSLAYSGSSLDPIV